MKPHKQAVQTGPIFVINTSTREDDQTIQNYIAQQAAWLAPSVSGMQEGQTNTTHTILVLANDEI